jgi:hypothetical protein
MLLVCAIIIYSSHVLFKTCRLLQGEDIGIDPVTSRSGALSELILRGHLLASDPNYYAIKTFDFDYEASWVDDMV